MDSPERRASHAGAGCSAAPAAEQWQVAHAQAKARLAELRLRAAGHPAPPVDILRSSQVDAARLDTELALMLGEQFSSVFKLFQAGSVARFEPELNGLLRLLIFGLSVWKGRATPGSELMNLRYRNERAAGSAAGGKNGVEGPGLSRAQRMAFGLGYVALPYLWSRLHRYAVRQEWGER
jgi:peroxin-2